MNPEVRLVWDLGAQLGEGPVWNRRDQALWFVDIKRGTVHRHSPESGINESFAIGGKPSFIVPTADGGMLVGSEDEICRFAGGVLGERIAAISMPAHNRTNDATVDAHGRLWVGTMDDNESLETGALYCLDRGVLHSMHATAIVTNGPAITADGYALYFVDSVKQQIWRHAVGIGPSISSPKLFLQLPEDDGYPDGVVLDSEDCLWVALWDGWGVRRYAPDGTLLLHVDLPCARVTKIAFGGPDLRTVFVTTAKTGLDQVALGQQPLAGGLFAFTSAVPGRILPAYRPCD